MKALALTEAPIDPLKIFSSLARYGQIVPEFAVVRALTNAYALTEAGVSMLLQSLVESRELERVYLEGYEVGYRARN